MADISGVSGNNNTAGSSSGSDDSSFASSIANLKQVSADSQQKAIQVRTVVAQITSDNKAANAQAQQG